MNYEAAFWLIAGLSMAGAALLIHALEYAVPIVARRVAGLRAVVPPAECDCEMDGETRVYCRACRAMEEE